MKSCILMLHLCWGWTDKLSLIVSYKGLLLLMYFLIPIEHTCLTMKAWLSPAAISRKRKVIQTDIFILEHLV